MTSPDGIVLTPTYTWAFIIIVSALIIAGLITSFVSNIKERNMAIVSAMLLSSPLLVFLLLKLIGVYTGYLPGIIYKVSCVV